MADRVLLNNVDHADLTVLLAHGAEYGDAVNMALIFPTEFAEVQREYPILFRRDPEGGYQAVALLGLDRDENLFLDGDGWQARYIPAVQARGPFSIGRGNGGEPMIHIDMDDPRVDEPGGLPLFLEHGGNAPMLERAGSILRVIHQGVELNAPMFAAFEAAELIEPIAMELQVDETTRYNLPDFLTVSQERLASLGAEQLATLNASGFLSLAFLQVASLANISALIDRKQYRRG
jgi:hypothetical protein